MGQGQEEVGKQNSKRNIQFRNEMFWSEAAEK